MRSKLIIVLISTLVIVIGGSIVYQMFIMKETVYSNYYDVLHIDEKYWGAAQACFLYLEEENMGIVEQVVVEEVSFGNVKYDIELIKGEYEDNDILWKFMFQMESKSVITIFCDSEYHGVRAVIVE